MPLTNAEAIAYATPCHPDYENWVQEAQALRCELERVKLDFGNACDVGRKLEANIKELKNDLIAGAASYAGTLRTMNECRTKADLRIAELEEQVRLRDDAMSEQTKDYAEWMSPEDYIPMRQACCEAADLIDSLRAKLQAAEAESTLLKMRHIEQALELDRLRTRIAELLKELGREE